MREEYSRDDRFYYLIGLVLGLYGGFIGLDRFYRGHTGLAVLKLITFGGIGIWWFVDNVIWASRLGKSARHLVNQDMFEQEKVSRPAQSS